MTNKERLMSMPIEELINETNSLKQQIIDDDVMLMTIQKRLHTNRMILDMNESVLVSRLFEVMDFKKKKEIK